MGSLSYLLNSGKNSKLPYYIRGYIRWLTPKGYTQRRLQTILRNAKLREDYPYIAARVEYYNKLIHRTALPADAPPLGEHRPSHPAVYFHDTYEYTRYFSDSLRWLHLPGDVIHVPEFPTVVKSRPIGDNNANSVLLKLDKVRHFVRIKDKTPFREKRDRVLFRGEVPGKENRLQFLRKFHDNLLVDAGDVSNDESIPNEWKRPKLTLYQHLGYKFIMALEGNDVASNLKWVMGTNSLAVMPPPRYETWFMEGTLQPNVHYVAVRPDYSDLEEQIAYFSNRPDEAEQIIKNANAYTEQFWDKTREDIISLLVLHKYFQVTGQLEKL